MNREQAIDHIWGLFQDVQGEFCCNDLDRDRLEQRTRQALLALGVTEEEL